MEKMRAYLLYIGFTLFSLLRTIKSSFSSILPNSVRVVFRVSVLKN